MSYMNDCRFTNTYADMAECLDALRTRVPLSAGEITAAKEMYFSVLDFMRELEIIEDYDGKSLIEYLDGFQEGGQHESA